jgi:hypothetical protein
MWPIKETLPDFSQPDQHLRVDNSRDAHSLSQNQYDANKIDSSPGCTIASPLPAFNDGQSSWKYPKIVL